MTTDDQLSAYGRKGPRHARGGRRHAPGWLAILVALVLALSWQSVVTTAHDHRYAENGLEHAAVHFDSGRHHQHENAPAHLPSQCLLCRAMAHAGAALLPEPVAFRPPVLAAIQPASSVLPGETTSQRSHRWQSRAPPQLQS